MSAYRVASGVAVSAAAGLPVAEAVRRPGRTFSDSPTWLVRNCPHCRRTHVHIADPVATVMVLPARCSAQRFYEVREVNGDERRGA